MKRKVMHFDKNKKQNVKQVAIANEWFLDNSHLNSCYDKEELNVWIQNDSTLNQLK